MGRARGPGRPAARGSPPPKNFMVVPLLFAGTGISAMLPSSSIQRAAGRCPARSGRRRRRGASNWAKSARVHAPRAGRLAGDSRGLAKHNKKKARWSAACTPKRSLSGGHARARAPWCGIAACGAAPCTARARTRPRSRRASRAQRVKYRQRTNRARAGAPQSAAVERSAVVLTHGRRVVLSPDRVHDVSTRRVHAVHSVHARCCVGHRG